MLIQGVRARGGVTYLNDRRCDLQRILAKIYKLKGILSSPTSYFSYPFLGTATRRTILVPAASPALGAVGNWSPPSPSASSPELPIDVRPPGLGLQLVRPLCKSFSSALMLRITLWSNSSNSFLVLRLRPPCLLKNFHAWPFFSFSCYTSSARACQRSRYRRRSPGLMFTNFWRIWAPSLPVALT